MEIVFFNDFNDEIQYLNFHKPNNFNKKQQDAENIYY